ncbi:hypothetical protein CY35_19G002300 [Sphagnum magellanicum]|nr:hypothetical protein CY35_19G002300 [Sphagnum magellanicum]
MDHQKLIPIESRAGHGRRAADLDGLKRFLTVMMQKLPQHLLKTSFHYQPAENWMNGPTYHKGYYHLFHQCNQSMPLWGPNISWAHAVSTYLVHWLYLEIVLEPDYTIGPNGVPFIIYTGGFPLWHQMGLSKMNHTFKETQNKAIPADPSDPLLRKNPTQVEDDGSWVFTVDSVIGETNTTGVAYLLKSKDLKHWELVDNHLYTLPGTRIWECIDFYHPDPSSQKYHDVYALGSYDSAAHKFIPDNPELDFSGFESSQYDYGRVYASDSFFHPVKQRHIVLSWVNEIDTEELELQRGCKTGVNFIHWPIEEVESLRISEQVKTGVKLDANAILKVNGATGSQLDMEVIFDYPDVSIDGVVTDEADSMNDQFNCSQGGSAHRGVFGPFGLPVLTYENFKEQIAVFFYIFILGMVNGSQGFAVMRPDFLSPPILVRLSTIAKKLKLQLALYNMRFAMK